MKRVIAPLAIAASVLLPSAGALLADNLHNLIPPNNQNPGAATAAPGQTGSNVLSSCGATPYFSIGSINGVQIKTNAGMNSPFDPSAPAKTYAGNLGNPPGNPTLTKNPIAVSQYDNACAQAARHLP
jgi:hypothetical protein